MYKQIQIEFQPAYIPAVGNIAAYQFNSSTYYIRGLFTGGHCSSRFFHSRLCDLEVDGEIKRLSAYKCGCVGGLDFVFAFDAPHCLKVMRLLVRLNEASINCNVQPLPDMEFVHPAAHALLYSLGGFSGSSADCYLNADPGAVDLNQKVR